MQYSSLQIDNKRRRTFVRLLGEIRNALNEALAEEFQHRKLTRKQIADTLGVDKSFVSKKFSGEGNMTLETLADLAYALDRPIKVSLPSRALPSERNSYLPSPSSGSVMPSVQCADIKSAELPPNALRAA